MNVRWGLMAATAILIGLGTACSEPFADAQKLDTIDAYETYLRENPEGRFTMEASARLEQLYLDKAKQEKTLAAYDVYLERFPEGTLRERGLAEREEFLYAWARETNTAASWQKFLDEYPRADKKRKLYALKMVDVHAYLSNLAVTEPTLSQVNLAEDPEGPLDGWGFGAEVTNDGPATIVDLRLTIQYLSPEGGVLGEEEWPVVAPTWPVPIEEEKKVPMKPGETRAWSWTSGDLPDRWDRKVRLVVTRIVLEGAGKK